MTRKSVIILGGAGGSGRSTLAEQLQELTGLQREYGGLRKIIKDLKYQHSSIKDRQVTDEELLVDFQKNYISKHPEIDLLIDANLLKRAQEGGVIIESMTLGPLTKRLGLNYIKVWVDAPINTRIKRIMNREANTTNDSGKFESIKEQLNERTANNQKRYLALYGFNYLDTTFYDFVFNTDEIDRGSMGRILLDKISSPKKH